MSKVMPGYTGGKPEEIYDHRLELIMAMVHEKKPFTLTLISNHQPVPSHRYIDEPIPSQPDQIFGEMAAKSLAFFQ